MFYYKSYFNETLDSLNNFVLLYLSNPDKKKLENELKRSNSCLEQKHFIPFVKQLQDENIKNQDYQVILASLRQFKSELYEQELFRLLDKNESEG